MTTIREAMAERLIAHGIWPAEAEAILDVAADHRMLEPMQGRWGNSTADYPEVLQGVTWLSVGAIAVGWLTENKPDHFALIILQGAGHRAPAPSALGQVEPTPDNKE